MVILIFKNGSVIDPNNCKPISILTIFSKVLEKLFHNLIFFINKRNILHSNQFGFRKNKSNSMAVAQVLCSLLNKCKANKKVVLTLLDVKKTFDFIDHDLLLIKLKHYGIRGTQLYWLCSYLTNHTQKSNVNNSFSSVLPISVGVLQGSLIDPILFILFIKDAFQYNSYNIEICLYADGTAIIFSAGNDVDLQLLANNFFSHYSNRCTLDCTVINPLESNFLFV